QGGEGRPLSRRCAPLRITKAKRGVGWRAAVPDFPACDAQPLYTVIHCVKPRHPRAGGSWNAARSAVSGRLCAALLSKLTQRRFVRCASAEGVNSDAERTFLTSPVDARLGFGAGIQVC